MKYWSCDSAQGVTDSFNYYYCRIKIAISNNCQVFNNLCISEIILNGKVIKFNGLSFVGTIIEFEPLRIKDRENFLKYINNQRRGYKTW